LSRLFGAASLVAPFAFGLVAGGVAVASRVGGVRAIPWTGAFAIVVGALAVCLCAQLAASFVVVQLERAGETQLLIPFRRRGLQAGAAVLALGVAALGVAALASPALFRRLTGVALPLVVLGLAAAGLSLLALVIRRYRVARAASLLTGVALVWGWLVAQSPNLIGSRLTIRTAAATPPALTAVAIACGLVLLGVLPALYLLFVMFARPRPEVIE
ncbi:MAG: cytochrome d ubiquinol oxidase subunit II, partial [Solirubrobacteraceae bacterium]